MLNHLEIKFGDVLIAAFGLNKMNYFMYEEVDVVGERPLDMENSLLKVRRVE